MNSLIARLFACILLPAAVWAKQSKPAPAAKAKETPPPTALVFRELRYDGRLTDNEARFVLEVTAESFAKEEVCQTLLEGELAVLPPKLPPALRLERTGSQYRLFVSKPGRYQFKLELAAKITRAEPWNQISVKGPPAAIAAVAAQAAGAGAELQLLTGTLLETAQTNGVARVKGFLGADQTLALRWSHAGGTAEVARKAVVTADTTVTAQITPTVIKYVTQLRYEIIQGKLPRLTLALPASQALTRLVGEQIRDWELKAGEASSPSADGAVQILSVEFIKPLEKEYQLTLFSEQTVEATPSATALVPPQPLELERESGSFTISTEDTLAEVASVAGLRQVNAAAGALAAYRFNGRPFTLALKLKRIEPVIQVADRISGRVEETRVLASHTLTLNVEKAGIYALDLLPPAGFVAADVRGEGLEDWKLVDAPAGGAKVLRVTFSSRVLGARKLEVQMEQPLKTLPEQIVITPLRISGAAKETAQIGAGSAPGIQLKTAELVGLREIPLNKLTGSGADELLGYNAEQPDWKLALTTERMAARIVADIFNLVTIGDGIVGGSATIRYGLINQGVQEFEVSVPLAWKNVEFTGPNIRRKEQKSPGLWTIGLQDKAWSGYTLVVTYDYQFDPKGATLAAGGIHAVGVERETGSVAITTAASLKLTAKTASDPLRRVDEAELAAADRAMITRAVLLAYQYTDGKYDLTVEAKRFDELPVLSAVADRTQLTTVLTEAGEMLTQASFMVKNNDKQFQKFKLPQGAEFWSCYVNGQAVKAERDNDWVMAPLPRGANRDQAFAVDIVYRETRSIKTSLFARAFQLAAPQTDVPNTYAEWQLFAPTTFRLSGFGGNMTVARGTTYDLRDAWQQFTAFYAEMAREAGPGLVLFGVVAVMVVALIGSAVRRGWNGVVSVLAVFVILAVLGGMLLPALSKSKARAQRISAVNSLKQIGLCLKQFAMDNGDRYPASLDEMMDLLVTEKLLIDPNTGERFVFVGGGQVESNIKPESVVAFSPADSNGQRTVLLADGHVDGVSREKFAELERRGFILPATAQEIAQNQQAAAVRGAQSQANGPPVGIGGSPSPSAAPTSPAQGAGVVTETKASGVRSIRIDIPRTEQAFTFTKVLNAGREPLAVKVGVMKWKTFQTAQMVLQVGAFLTGLFVWWWQWQRSRNSFLLTLALAFMIGSVTSLLLAWRMLHEGLIWAAPVLLLALLGWLTWKYWPRSGPAAAPAPATLEPGIPPAVAAIVIAFFALNAEATDSRSDAADGKLAIGNPLAIDRSRQPARDLSESAIPSVSVLSATYTGTVNERVAQVDATILVSSARPDQKLPLFGEDVAVEQFTSKSGDVRLVRENNAVAVVLPRRGETTLHLKLLVKLGGDVTKRQLGFAIPAALSSQVVLTIAQPEADVEFPTAISFKRATAKEQTRVEAIIGSGERVELRWTPRVKRAAEIAANVICHNATLASFGSGVLNTRATLDYQVTQGEMRQARVRLPAGHRLLRVEGESIRTWEIRPENGEQVLLVELLKGVAPSYRLTVETEKVLEAMPAVVKTEVPHALDVKRETGLLALRADEDLELGVERAEELHRVDADEFARATGQKAQGMLNAFRFLKPDFGLETRVAATEPQIETVARNRVRISPEQVTISGTIDYTIKRAGVFALRVGLPAGYRLEEVAGNNILQWAERMEADQRVLEVSLKERTSGTYSLRLELVQSLKELAPTLPISGVHPLGVQKLTGFVSVSAEPGVALKPATADGLVEVPAAAIPGHDAGGSVLAYKFIAGEPRKPSGPPWKLAVATETVESWVRAEIVNTLTLSDALVSGRALAHFEIQNAPVKELRLKIPGAFRNVEITGANIRRRDHTGELWRVEFQNKLRGAHTLTVTWDQPRTDRGTNHLDLTGLSAEGVERETGILAIVARPPLQVAEQSAADLQPIDTRDLPEWAGRPDEATVLAYRYLRPGYKLALEAKRFAEAEVLQALVENLNLTTVVADDGQMMTEMALSIRNHGRQHLEIALPADAKVWSAFVAGQPVRPSVRENKLLLPLEQSGSEDSAIAVELTYVGASQFPQTRGEIELVSPKLDVPLKGARWELFLPPDYRYSDFVGTMARETAAAVPQAASFSRIEYRQRESQNRAELDKELKSDLFNAQKKLSSGKVKEAWADYSRARNKGNFDENKNAETRKLEEDLRRAQGSNLIMAQNEFSVNNSGQAAGAPAQKPAAGAQVLQYDKDAAEAQWAKLQQAQDLGLAKVQPIRVNLPTRGLRHAFTQVLQTEVGKPMTIRLLAANAKVVSWPKRLGSAIGGFLVLWGIVVAFSRRSLGDQQAHAAA